MINSRIVCAVAFLAASGVAVAQEQARQPAPKAPVKAEQPATAAGGQSSGTVGTGTGTIAGVKVGTIVVVGAAVAAVAVVANQTRGTTSH